MVRAGRPFTVVTGDWHSAPFATAVTQWARAAAAVTRWRSLKVAVFGYAMNGMGDIRVDEHSLLRDARPADRRARARRAASAPRLAVPEEDVRALIE